MFGNEPPGIQCYRYPTASAEGARHMAEGRSSLGVEVLGDKTIEIVFRKDTGRDSHQEGIRRRGVQDEVSPCSTQGPVCSHFSHSSSPGRSLPDRGASD